MSADYAGADIVESLHKSLLNLYANENFTSTYYLNELTSQNFSLLTHPQPLVRKLSAFLLCFTYRKLLSAIQKESREITQLEIINKMLGTSPQIVQNTYKLTPSCPLIRQDDIVYLWLQQSELPASLHHKTQLYNNSRKRYQSEEYMITYILNGNSPLNASHPSTSLWLGVYADRIPVLLKNRQSLESLPDPQIYQLFMDVYASRKIAAKIIHPTISEVLSKRADSHLVSRSPLLSVSHSNRLCTSVGKLRRRRKGFDFSYEKPLIDSFLADSPIPVSNNQSPHKLTSSTAASPNKPRAVSFDMNPSTPHDSAILISNTTPKRENTSPGKSVERPCCNSKVIGVRIRTLHNPPLATRQVTPLRSKKLASEQSSAQDMAHVGVKRQLNRINVVRKYLLQEDEESNRMVEQTSDARGFPHRANSTQKGSPSDDTSRKYNFFLYSRKV